MFSFLEKKNRLKAAIFAGVALLLVAGLLFVSCSDIPSTDSESEYKTSSLPDNLKGTWVSEYGEVFIISEQTFTSKYEDDVLYEGTIVGHRSNDSGAGYITIQYTAIGEHSTGVIDNFYVIHYKDLTATTVSLAGAGNESDLGDGKATQAEAEAAYTVTGGYFGMYSNCTKDSGGSGGEQSATTTYYPTDAKFTEIMAFFAGEDDEGWMSYDAYVIHKWSDFTGDHWDTATDIFPDMASTRADLKTYSGGKPENDDYIFMYCDDVFMFTGYGMSYMGIVRAVNVFNDGDEGAFIIEYFEGCDPKWLYEDGEYQDSQGLNQGDKPFGACFYEKTTGGYNFGNPSDQTVAYGGDDPWYTETDTLEEAVNKFNYDDMGDLVFLPMFGGPWMLMDCEMIFDW